MKKITISICWFFIFVSAGCQDQAQSKSGVEVIIEGGGEFPEFLVGRWKADKGGWEINFEQDGKISSAVVSLGKVRLVPDRITETQMVLGGKGFFKPGKWTVQYSPPKKELGVNIIIENFRIELGDDVVQGRTRDFFIGQVSADGQVWWADRYNFPEYIVDTEKYQNYKLPFDPNDSPRESLVFQKVANSK